ncbi:MAG: benzoate transporter [Paenibacillus sp.]|nr:benzoate transporter [Paenibacillus sp.]
MLIYAADVAGFDRVELVSWFFAVYVLGGILNLFLSSWYKIPFSGAHSITAVAFLSTTITGFSLEELAGSYMMAGLLICLFGLTGFFTKILEYIPKPLIEAMLAGLVTKYVVSIVPAIKDFPLAGGLALVGFFVAPKVSKWIPPLLGVLIFGVAGLIWGYDFPDSNTMEPFVTPQLVEPIFTTHGFFSITLPVVVLVLSNDIAVGLTALKKNGFDPAVNNVLLLTGLGTMLAAFFGGHAVNIGGMMTALCSSEEAGRVRFRYRSAIISAVLVIIFGLFAWKAIVLIKLLPSVFIQLISGFALVGVLTNSLQAAFSDSSFRYSTLFAFVIAVANVPLMGIASPIWSLAMGSLTASIFGEGKKQRERRVRIT